VILASPFKGINLHLGISGTFDIENYGDLLFPMIAEAELTRRLGALTLRGGLGLTRPYLIVQANPALRVFARFVRKHPQMLRGYQLMVLPTGPVHGDDDAIFGDDLPGTVRPPAYLNPLVLAELVKHASGVIAVSLHLSITALAFGVPLFRPVGSFGGKHAILAGCDGVFTFNCEGGIDPQRFAAGAGRGAPSPMARSAIRQLDRHWDRISDVFLAADESPSVRRKISRFRQAMPGVMEEYSTARMEMEEREGRIAALYNSTLREVTARFFGVVRRLRRCGETTRIEGSTLSTEPYEWASVGELFAPGDATLLAASFPRDHFKTVVGYDGEKGYEYEARALVGMGRKRRATSKT